MLRIPMLESWASTFKCGSGRRRPQLCVWILLILQSSRMAQPNTRLKLAAPVPNGCGSHLELQYDRFSFVVTLAWRRSLSAIR